MSAQATLEQLTQGHDLDAAGAEALVGELVDPATPDALIAGILTALRAKGECAAELVGITRALLARARGLPGAPADAVDTCGTGGDRGGTFNISTAAGLLAAACGVPVVKHGNRSVTSRSGSADVIEALGIAMQQPDTAPAHPHFVFLFAPHFHPALGRIGPVRKALGIRTVFNLVGPLANPARATYQLVGVAAPERMVAVAETLRGLGRKRAFVVHGEHGLDEATTAGATRLIEVDSDGLRERVIRAADFGLPGCAPADLRGGDAAENARLIEALLGGARGPGRDTVVLNAALVLMLTGREPEPRRAARQAEQAIDSGAAAALLAELRGRRG
ncbi:MAG: anthranilate phosphoribosyltransferase [Planctomycetes bacterium]|jgi:anthranilate phosphoribosyltransferase|nr:anthranilate phosphoribosyltransferase [Planctomycetota bacterium]MCL4730278.1 anthranilate phosphoribosyltransferase [Planctomycetota bacterium]